MYKKNKFNIILFVTILGTARKYKTPFFEYRR
jgi:hypothetical protein